jgi:hypothetical protein
MSEQENQERPLIVKSQNFTHSTNLLFPEEPPTDRQILYLRRLGDSGILPKSRKEASERIDKMLKREIKQ